MIGASQRPTIRWRKESELQANCRMSLSFLIVVMLDAIKRSKNIATLEQVNRQPSQIEPFSSVTSFDLVEKVFEWKKIRGEINKLIEKDFVKQSDFGENNL